MILKIKILVTYLLGLLGIGVYFLRDRKPDISVEWVDNLYREHGHELSRKRQRFYNSIIRTITSYGVSFEDKTVLDIGCGDGRLLETIKDNFNVSGLKGVDLSSEAVKLAKETIPEATIEKANILASLGYTADIVLCTEVLEHITDPDKALSNIIGTITQGGCLFLVVPNGRTDNWEGHINFWSTVSWQALIAKYMPGAITGELGGGHLFSLWCL